MRSVHVMTRLSYSQRKIQEPEIKISKFRLFSPNSLKEHQLHNNLHENELLNHLYIDAFNHNIVHRIIDLDQNRKIK